MKNSEILGALQSIMWQLGSSDVSGAKNDLNTLISELETDRYDVDVDEDGSFITPKPAGNDFLG